MEIDKNTFSVANKVVRTKMCPVDVRFVVICKRHKKYKPYQYFCLFTSDLEIPVANLIRHYKNRWQIETAFRDAKQHFGFDACQLKHRKNLNRFAQLCFIAACLTQLIFTQPIETKVSATLSQENENLLEVETVLHTQGIHWYKPKHLTRGLMVAYLQMRFQQQVFSVSYDHRQNSKKK